MELSSFEALFGGIYQNKTVLVTGHTGFKGSWLTFWLQKMGAKVVGYALEPNKNAENHFSLLGNNYLENKCLTSYFGDINDKENLEKIVQKHQPDIIFHLAAQALVRYSYQNPAETYQTNLIGTLNVYEVAKNCPSVKAIVSITTDKVYENQEWLWGYRENDRLGGHDPYSASKACVEIMTASYRKSFLQDYQNNNSENKKILLATARAGNVVGGGDWAVDRLFPDMMRAIQNNETVNIRNPKAIRPWQHVLEPLAGYLQLGQQLLEGNKMFADAWNFSPESSLCIEVGDILALVKQKWNKLNFKIEQNENQPHEANILKLDNTKATSILQWIPIWNTENTINQTVEWYKNWIENKILLTETQLEDYVKKAQEKNLIWTR